MQFSVNLVQVLQVTLAIFYALLAHMFNFVNVSIIPCGRWSLSLTIKLYLKKNAWTLMGIRVSILMLLCKTENVMVLLLLRLQSSFYESTYAVIFMIYPLFRKEVDLLFELAYAFYYQASLLYLRTAKPYSLYVDCSVKR